MALKVPHRREVLSGYGQGNGVWVSGEQQCRTRQLGTSGSGGFGVGTF